MNHYVNLTIVGLFCYLGGVLNERERNDNRARFVSSYRVPVVLRPEELPTQPQKPEGHGPTDGTDAQALRPSAEDWAETRWKTPIRQRDRLIRNIIVK